MVFCLAYQKARGRIKHFVAALRRQWEAITSVRIRHSDSRDVLDTREPSRFGRPGGFDGVPGGAHRAGSVRDFVTGLIVGPCDENMKRDPTGAVGLCRGDRTGGTVLAR